MNKDLLLFGKKINHIGFFGLGKSNLALLQYILSLSRDIKITVRQDAPLTERITQIAPSASIRTGREARQNFSEDIIFLSPTVRRDEPALEEAKRKGIYLSSDVELFFELDLGLHFGITGSDGKSTTTALTASILTESGIPASPAGNYGIPLASVIGRNKATVVELSSFQLMYTSPRLLRACITNITENHLNWHKGYTEYISAKENILKNARNAVYDFDSPDLCALMRGREVFAVSSVCKTEKALRASVKAENYLTLSGDYILLNGEKYISLQGAVRREEYNIRNYMSALAMSLGLHKREAAERAIRGFGGLMHRAETVYSADGIEYINSSIDTSPERTEKTLGSLSGRIAIILAGRTKGQSYDKLIPLIKQKCVGAVIMGELSEIISKSFGDFPAFIAEDMSSAVKYARALLVHGGKMLFSPSATSFDAYNSFEERGADFVSHVKGII